LLVSQHSWSIRFALQKEVNMVKTLKFRRTVSALPAEVYRAFTNSTALREWLCDAAQADPRKGGRLYLWWNSDYYTSGEYVAVAPCKKIAFTWRGRGEPDATRVQVSLAEKNGGTVVTLTHGGIGSGKKWSSAAKEFQSEWEASLENLQSVLETGQDLRVVRRPVLGISLGEFNAEMAVRLGVPVTEGARLDDVLEGRAARAAGLRKDDVIVRLGGKKIAGSASFVSAMQSHRAGDKVVVAFYRGPEKKTVTMELSPRPLPELPSSAEALADAARKMYASMDAELARCLEGVSEAEALHQPAPGEWSVKETLAHLVIDQREWHVWITDLITGDERWSDINPTNVPARLAAAMIAFPTAPLLVEELKRHEAETVAMLAALPPEFMAHRGSCWRLGYITLVSPDHFQTHLGQIRAAIEVARK
jgi:uncharacterized protein YndB with AHSA1/START domain